MVLETLQHLCEIDKCIKVNSPCERFPDSWLHKKNSNIPINISEDKNHRPQTSFKSHEFHTMYQI